MSEVDALYRLLADAPPRSAEIVKRVTLSGLSFEQLAQLYGVDVPRAQVLVFRALLDVQSGGSARVADDREPAEIAAMLSTETSAPTESTEGIRLRELWKSFVEQRQGLESKLEEVARQFASSPERTRLDRLRWVAIVLVLALTYFFYRHEQDKQRPSPPISPQVGPSAHP